MRMRKLGKIMGIVFFVLAGLMILYSGWAFINCQGYISDAVAAGQLVTKGSEYDIVSFYMANSAQYITFGTLLFGMGWLLYWRPLAPSQVSTAEPSAQNASPKEDELDAWFEEMRKSSSGKV